MIEQVFISGEIGKAVFAQDDRYFVVGVGEFRDPVEYRPGDVSFLFDSGAEFSVISNSHLDVADISSLLEFQTRAHRALSVTISGMDDDLSSESRLLSVEAAEEFLEDEWVYAFVRARMLARMLPSVADLTGALSNAGSAGANLTAAIYEEVSKSQGAIAIVVKAWKETAPEFFDSIDEENAAEKVLIETGVFAEMVAALTSGDSNRLNSLVITYGRKPELGRAVPRVVHLINAMRARLLDKVVTGTESAEYLDGDQVTKAWEVVREGDGDLEVSDPIAGLIAQFDKRRNWKPSRANERLTKINNQIASIGKLMRTGDFDRAYTFIVDLIEFHLEHSEKAHAAMSLCSLAKIAFDFRSFDMAGLLVEYAFLLNVEDAVISTLKAEILRTRGLAEGALKVYEDTINRFPYDVVARTGYAEVLKDMGQFGAALKAYEETMSRFPDNVVARSGYAEALKDTGQLEAALKEYGDTIGRFPNDVVARTGYAEVLKDMGQVEAALKAYEETMSRFPDNVVARSGYAEVLKEMGQSDAALKLYEETISRFPDNVVARNGYAEVLKEMGQSEAALKMYEEAMSRFPDNVVARSGYAEVLKDIGQLEAALKVYEETMSRFPDNVVARSGYAEVLKDMGHFEAALRVYERAMSRFPDNVVARNGYADVLKQMQRFEDALTVYEETMSRFPDDVVARSGYAEVLKDMDRFEAALKAYEDAINRFPADAVARNGYAEVLKDMGQFQAALKMYEETLNRFPDNVGARSGYAEVLKATGQLEAALIVYEEAMSRFPDNVVTLETVLQRHWLLAA